MHADPTCYAVLRIAGRAFVLDIPRSVVFAVDEEAVEALEFVTDSEQADCSEAGAGLSAGVAEAAREWQEMLAQGFLRSRFGEGVPSRPSYLRTVELSVTHRCTMRCRYCYSGHDAATRTAPLDMPEEVMEAALEWAAKDFARESRHLHITAGVTGEGTLRLDAYQQIQERTRQLARETGKVITCAIGNTNLTLAEDPEVWEVLTSPEGHVWSVSFDGPPEIHNANRMRPDGTGTYEVVSAAWRRILESAAGPSYLAQAVITGEHPNVKEIFLHLDQIGFPRILTRPVRGRPDQPFAITAETVGAVKQGYTDLVSYLLDQDDVELLRLLLKLWIEWDFLGRTLWRVAYHQASLFRCQAAKDLVCVDTNGDLYPCPGMVGERALCIGSVFTGITEAARKQYYEDLLVTRTPGCKECWARHLCGGGCYHAAYLVNGRVDEVDPADCELMRHRIELAVYMISCLKQDRPAVFAALPHPTQATLNQAAVASCIAVRKPLALDDAVGEWRVAKPMRLDHAGQAKCRVWAGCRISPAKFIFIGMLTSSMSW